MRVRHPRDPNPHIPGARHPLSVDRRAFLRWGGLTAAGLVLGGHSATATPAAAAPILSRRPVALIANSLSDTLTVADAQTLGPVGTLRVGREPHKFRLSLTGRSVYSCNVTSNEMVEIDVSTLRILRRIPILDPYNVVFTHDGRYLYKLAYRYTFVEIHDGATFQRLKRLPTGRQPSHFAVSPDGRWFVNANQRADAVSVIDTQTMTIARLIPVDPLPAGVAISQDGRHMFVASGGAGTISVFTTDEWRLTKKLHSGKDTHEMAATQDGRTIFVTNRGENTVSVFDVARREIVTKFPVPGGPDMPVLSADGSQVWVSGRYGDTTTVVDTRTLKILSTFRTGHSPHGVFLVPDRG